MIVDRLADEAETQILEAVGEKEADILRYENHVVHFATERVELRTRGGFGSLIHLYRDHKGTALVVSPYGKMVLKTVLQDWRQDEGEWMVDYRILDERNQVVGNRRLIWQMTEMK